LKAAILVSGSGSNLQSFIDQVADNRVDLEITVVMANRRDAYGLTRAKNSGIETACIEHGQFADRETFDRAVAKELDRFEPALIILAGFMRILSPWFVRYFHGKILNIHPALLPLYPGLHTHDRVLKAGDAHHGSTVHFVTDELDGGPRILAGRIAIRADDTADTLMSRVQAVEHQIYPQAAQLFAEGRVTYRDGNAWLDGQIMTDPLILDY